MRDMLSSAGIWMSTEPHTCLSGLCPSHGLCGRYPVKPTALLLPACRPSGSCLAQLDLGRQTDSAFFVQVDYSARLSLRATLHAPGLSQLSRVLPRRPRLDIQASVVLTVGR